MPLRDPGLPSKRVTSARRYAGAPVAALPPLRSVSAASSISTASARKPPESLRRAVADCLSPPAPHSHGPAASAAAQASRTLRDYIANPSTIDMVYNVLIDHALAESDRSPAVVLRCVALLKRYLIRYIPRVQTLRQIDLFCANTIAKCEPMANHRAASVGQNYAAAAAAAAPNSSPLAPPISNFASASLVKSLNYVRSLVARHIPKLLFQPAVQSVASKQSLPSLSSFLNRSLVSQLTPEVISNREHLESKECHSSSDLISSSSEKVDGVEPGDDSKYISFDILNWRWHVYGEQQASTSAKESNDFVGLQDFHTHGFLEVGAAALLVGDMEAKINDQQWKYSVIQEFPDIDLLQPSTSTGSTFASSQSHLKAITASKRMKSGPNQVWMNIPANTFQPRARPLFQYRHYSEQQPLRLNPAEISEVIAEVCSETTSNANQSVAPSRLTTQSRQPSADVAFSVLIKLVIDMYMMDSKTAAPLTLYMLEGMLSSQKSSARTKALDLILNLGVHAHLLEPMAVEDAALIDKNETVNHSYLSNKYGSRIDEPRATIPEEEQKISPAIDQFESWVLKILYEVLLLLVQMEERQEIVWASSLSCLFYFVCDGGKIIRSRLGGLDIRVVKTLLEISVEHSWAKVVHSKLICLLTNMMYQVSDVTQNGILETHFIPERIDLLGGIDYICLEYSQANSREEKRDLFFVIFDYVVHQINEACLAGGISTYTYDDAQPLASLLAFADAPEAFYISVKHGVEGVGDMLRQAISAALSQSAEYEQLNLLDKVIRKLDGAVSTFSRIDNEFSYMIQVTKPCKCFNSIKDGCGDADVALRARLCWATLHSLLHSQISSYRHHGYIWLVELLLSEISEEADGSIWFKIQKLQEEIEVTGSQDLSYSEVSLPVCLLCGLLKSKHNFIRWGFLYVLDKFLMRCKLLLDDSDMQEHTVADHKKNRLDKAFAVIDIMNSALLLVVQNNETDHINILKMCDMLFSQLCLRIPSTNVMHLGSLQTLGQLFGCTTKNIESHLETLASHQNVGNRNLCRSGMLQEYSINQSAQSTLLCEASVAALLLRGLAIAPMQLVARVPTSLFFWPLIQLEGAASDDIALGIAVGSTGRGNLPGATSDIRAALLLLLLGKCTADQEALKEVEGNEFFRGLLDDTDSRVAYYSAAFLLKRMMTEEPEIYQRMLQSLISKAQQCNNEKLLENPYLQMRGILQLSNDLGVQ
ncbi:uncharacterized protein LOC133909697 isoform X2 [Phragmites australis]|uniref:uncharacterized protein LOC133909697 isoform X2 n=1 Tax=Phragmites australis TaxID=29695 RepID=UPI002D788DA7|nr:uncharacterized protein LOC133909697 isoform X2 [Phragmites australis]